MENLKMRSNRTALVKGEILFGKDIGSFSGVTVNVYLEDVTLQDAASQIVAEQAIPNVRHERGTDTWLEFALYGEKPDQRASYSIRVHVDLHGDRQIHSGDYITKQTYPVLTFGHPSHVSVTVHGVK